MTASPAAIRAPRAALALALLAAVGCGSGAAAPPQPSAGAQPAQAPAPAAPRTALGESVEAAPAEATPDAGGPSAAASDPLTVVIDPGGSDPAAARSLVEAAAAERERRRRAGAPTVVIDDKNLSDYADVELTIAGEQPPAEEAEPEADAAARERLAKAAEAERYWRARVLEQRLRWRNALDAISRLERRVGELRTQFYAEDDPYYRDSQIKPAWDLALSELGHYRAEVSDAQAELDRVLLEGREAGAMPGWLREGLELEPDREAPAREGREPGLGVYEPKDPETVEPRDTEDGGGRG